MPIIGAGRHTRSAAWLRSVRTQLIVPIVVATAGLLLLGAVQTSRAVGTAGDAGRARVLAGTATATVRLVHELEREYAETAALRARGGTAGRQLVTAQRERVDQELVRYREARLAAGKEVPELTAVLEAADVELGRLGLARKTATGSSASGFSDTAYRDVAEALLAVADALPAQLRDADLAGAAREVAVGAAREHLAALERDLVGGVLVRGRATTAELTALARLRGAQDQRQAEFAQIASADGRRFASELLTGPDLGTAERMSDAILAVDPGLRVDAGDADAWYVAQSGTIRGYHRLGLELSERLDRLAAEQAGQAARQAWLTGLGSALVALTALGAAVLLALRISRRLNLLQSAALTVADTELPERIAAVSGGRATTGEDTAAATTARIAQGRDEIAQLAQAFASVQQVAVDLAVRQAELRLDLRETAEALARRIRTLVTRQLRLLDEYERAETDPQALARLFALDHLAARLRRNGDNLLVLAGADPARSQPGGHHLSEVVAAAASEIENFDRVAVELPDVAVSGRVVGSLVHLLAELLENATSFSPPTAAVQVQARVSDGALLIRVCDQGIGIGPERLSEINSLLAAPAGLSSRSAGHMGLHVVAHLAARNGFQVELESTGAGVIAYVGVPAEALAPLDSIRPAAERAIIVRPVGTPPAALAAAGGGAVTSGRSPAAASLPAWPTSVRGATAPAVAGQRPVLPRRNRGEQLAPEPAPAATSRVDPLDPELVRSRLSALAAGVSAALRRDPPPNQRERSE